MVIDTLNYRKVDRVERIVMRRRTWLDNALLGFKQIVSISFSRSTSWTFGSRGNVSGGGTIDYREKAGDGRNNAIVLASLELLSTTFAQSPIVVKKIVGDSETIVPTHEMTQRLVKPNDYYSGKLLWKATLIDYAFGNAYWLKVRSAADKPVQFFWVPSSMIEPAWPADNPKVYISHYNYTPNGKKERIEIRDVVHFRNGLDPMNIRKGLSPLGALLREIATDEEAAEYTHTILRNLGVAGMVISPLTDKGKISQPDAEKIKASVMTRTTGDRRGEPLVLGGAVKVDQMGVDPGKLDLGAIRHVPEERITGIFGTPAVLVGMGTGLEKATFSNVDGLRRIFYENKVIPIQGFIAEDLHTHLLPDYEGKPEQFVISFDNDAVRVLKEDETDLVTRLLKEMEGGGMTLNEYRAERNREPIAVDMYMLSSRIIPVAVDKVLDSAQQSSANNTGTGTGSAGSSGNNGSSDNTNSSDSGSGITGSAKADRQHVQASTKDIGDSIERIRLRMQGQAARDVLGFLTGQREFVIAQVLEQSKGAGAGSESVATKLRINWSRLQEDIDALKSVVEPWYKRVLVAVHDVVQDVLDTRYELTGSDERTYLKSAGLNIKGINETTRTAVADTIRYSVDLDETTDELITRLRALNVFSDDRAVLIAKTELAQATNLAQVESYKASEVVVGILITDGDADKVCKDLNGKRVKIAEARSIPPLGHPNCVRRFHHITDVKELESSEAA